MTPTPEQSSIISAAAGTQDLMVLALAGTGKTTTIELLTSHLPTTSVLALAFNVKIKEELTKRMPPHVKVMTLNGLGHKAWWQTVRRNLELNPKKPYNILDDICLSQNLRFSNDERSDIVSLFNAARSLGFVPKGSPIPGQPLIRDNPDGIEELFEWAEVDEREDYEVILRSMLITSIRLAFSTTIDFNDQIYMPTVFGSHFDQYHTVLVDEAQDLSALNHRMILSSCAKRLIVVGDPNQAIYAFRGALSNSMDELRFKRDFLELPLTVTFRCGKAIVKRQQEFVPDYKAADTNADGEVQDWTRASSEESSGWVSASVPPRCAILCRNNAPLFKLAFKLIRAGRGITMLGNDMGKSLDSALTKATKGLPSSAPSPDVVHAVDKWRDSEMAKAKTDRRRESVQDRAACLRAIAEAQPDLQSAKQWCYRLFENKEAAVVLGSGHRSKGLEWDSVIHLDAWRIPSPYAVSKESLRQEANIKYVIETRAKKTLILANLEDFRA